MRRGVRWFLVDAGMTDDALKGNGMDDPEIELYRDGKLRFDQLSIKGRKIIWDENVDLYDWVANQAAAGECIDMDDVIRFFAYETNPHHE